MMSAIRESTSGMSAWSTTPLSGWYVEKILVAMMSCAMPMNASAVKLGGPTAMNMAGRDMSAGRPEVRRRPK